PHATADALGRTSRDGGVDEYVPRSVSLSEGDDGTVELLHVPPPLPPLPPPPPPPPPPEDDAPRQEEKKELLFAGKPGRRLRISTPDDEADDGAAGAARPPPLPAVRKEREASSLPVSPLSDDGEFLRRFAPPLDYASSEAAPNFRNLACLSVASADTFEMSKDRYRGLGGSQSQAEEDRRDEAGADGPKPRGRGPTSEATERPDDDDDPDDGDRRRRPPPIAEASDVFVPPPALELPPQVILALDEVMSVGSITVDDILRDHVDSFDDGLSSSLDADDDASSSLRSGCGDPRRQRRRRDDVLRRRCLSDDDTVASLVRKRRAEEDHRPLLDEQSRRERAADVATGHIGLILPGIWDRALDAVERTLFAESWDAEALRRDLLGSMPTITMSEALTSMPTLSEALTSPSSALEAMRGAAAVAAASSGGSATSPTTTIVSAASEAPGKVRSSASEGSAATASSDGGRGARASSERSEGSDGATTSLLPGGRGGAAVPPGRKEDGGGGAGSLPAEDEGGDDDDEGGDVVVLAPEAEGGDASEESPRPDGFPVVGPGGVAAAGGEGGADMVRGEAEGEFEVGSLIDRESGEDGDGGGGDEAAEHVPIEASRRSREKGRKKQGSRSNGSKKADRDVSRQRLPLVVVFEPSVAGDESYLTTESGRKQPGKRRWGWKKGWLRGRPGDDGRDDGCGCGDGDFMSPRDVFQPTMARDDDDSASLVSQVSSCVTTESILSDLKMIEDTAKMMYQQLVTSRSEGGGGTKAGNVMAMLSPEEETELVYEGPADDERRQEAHDARDRPRDAWERDRQLQSPHDQDVEARANNKKKGAKKFGKRFSLRFKPKKKHSPSYDCTATWTPGNYEMCG
ncbi:hypothetical protein ACHAWF_017179, partial [Thalassiosira exigua]